MAKGIFENNFHLFRQLIALNQFKWSLLIVNIKGKIL